VRPVVGNCAYGLHCTLDLILQSSHLVVEEKYKLLIFAFTPHSRRSLSKSKAVAFHQRHEHCTLNLESVMAQPPAWKRLASTTTSTFTAKTASSKAHLHKPIADDLFPRGYLLGGIHSGVKKDASILDLAVFLSTSSHPTSAAAAFTRNSFQAAPVTVSKSVLEQTNGRARALVVNSGCANAVTGRQGLADAWAMASATDALLAPAFSPSPSSSPPSSSSETLVMSTGVIGETLPISKILNTLRQHGPLVHKLGRGFTAWEAAARAFMTTDSFPKLRARTLPLGNGRMYRIAGIDKGAGMIHPDMVGVPRPSPSAPHATLLGCIATDAPVAPAALQSALDYAVQRSFNAISVDGDMSTNDTVVLFANGAGADEVGGRDLSARITETETEIEIDETRDPGAFVQFRDGLTDFMQELAQLVVRDGEGATKFVTISVDVRVFDHPMSAFRDSRDG
jgi:glutamate N-acetyltransferase/amino-acid N-acetyltransferase